jgi:hypothetical protein
MEAEVAFGVLYDAGDEISAIGPVVRRQNLTGYTITSKDDALKARLFILPVAALEASADGSCAMLSSRVEQIACNDRVNSCKDDSVACLSVLRASESCGDRLTLPKSVALKAYSANDKGDFVPIADPAPLLAQLQLCGPTIKLSCPLRLPGFTVTEHGEFRCVAPSRQIECDLSIDLADCGLGAADGHIANDGTFDGKVGAAGCAIAQPMPGEVASSGTGFAIACGGRRFVASYMEQLFGSAGCPRRGPAAYEEAPANEREIGGSATRASITGLKVVKPTGWRPRYLVLGTGYDECAFNGCLNRGDCGMCDTECTSVMLRDCRRENEWAACITDGDAASDCVDRCKRFCASGASDCTKQAFGHVLTITSTLAPERDAKRIYLHGVDATKMPITGHRGLLALGTSDHPSIVVAGEGALRLYTTSPSDEIVESPPALVMPPTFVAAGIAEVPGQGDQLVVFGRTTDNPSKGALIPVEIVPGQPPSLAMRGPAVPVVELPTIDDVAVTSDGRLAVAASISSSIDVAPARMLAVRAIDGSAAPAPIGLGGRATALAALPGGGFAVAVDLGMHLSEIDLYAGSGTGFGDAVKLPVIGRLRVSAMALETATCGDSSALCRVFVGFEQDGDVSDVGNALVGLLEYHPGAPSMSRLVPSLIKTAAPELTTLEYDALAPGLIGAASTQNRITQIMLVR